MRYINIESRRYTDLSTITQIFHIQMLTGTRLICLTYGLIQKIKKLDSWRSNFKEAAGIR
jgi:hypothetical protein